MARYLPPDVKIGPMPGDFTVDVTDNGKVLRASMQIEGMTYEIGLRPKRNREEIAQAVRDLIFEMWQIVELHRIGRDDLIAYAAANRHTAGRPFHPIQLGSEPRA